MNLTFETLGNRAYALSRELQLSRGFTLIELMIVVAIVAVLAAIAFPSYQNFINKSRERSAGADLMALSTDLENTFQRTLTYPTQTTTTTATTEDESIGWSASQGDFFTYSVVSTPNGYDLTATGTGALAGCNLTLNEANTRDVATACLITSW